MHVTKELEYFTPYVLLRMWKYSVYNVKPIMKPITVFSLSEYATNFNTYT